MKAAAFDAGGLPMYSLADMQHVLGALCTLVGLDEFRRTQGATDYRKGSPSWQAWERARAVILYACRDAPLDALRPDLTAAHPAARKLAGARRSPPTGSPLPDPSTIPGASPKRP